MKANSRYTISPPVWEYGFFDALNIEADNVSKKGFSSREELENWCKTYSKKVSDEEGKCLFTLFKDGERVGYCDTDRDPTVRWSP